MSPGAKGAERMEVHRIEVGFRPGVVDALGREVARAAREDLGLPVEDVRTIAVYTIEADLSGEELKRLADELFVDPIVQAGGMDEPLPAPFDWLIEVGFLPGVTDNVGRTSLEGMRDLLGRPFADGEAVYTSRQYLARGPLARGDVERIARGLLANDLIERWTLVSREEWERGARILAAAPRVSGEAGGRVREYDLEVPDEQLLRISEEGVLSLSLEEMRAIRDYYRRPEVREARARLGLGPRPIDAELEALAQTWSEHCKHKIFNARIRYLDEETGERATIDSLFRTYIRGATEAVGRKVDWLLSVFHDNAGVIRFNEDWSLVMKVETHNAPSALDPYGGAITGIVGVNRDVLGTGKGARPLFNTDVFCFAAPEGFGDLPPGVLHPKRIARGVHRGVRDGGNQSGIPTVNGAIVFDPRYRVRPLVFCGTAGIMPAMVGGKPSHEKGAHPGDLIVMVGGRVGKDGIHGATFSSAGLTQASPTSAVQIGDPITQKRMLDFLLEARDEGLYTCITDNGAGGLSSSVGEMARGPGGCTLHLDRAPLKYPGLDPWEILLSESQERMTIAVPPAAWEALRDLAGRRGVEVTALGEFTDGGLFHVLYRGRTVACLDMEFLHEGVPRLDLEARWRRPSLREPDLRSPEDLGAALLTVLSRLDVASKEAFVRQYDHEVQGGSAVKPFLGAREDGPSDAGVVRPLLGSREGVVVACGICPRYSDLDAYQMAANAVDEAVRNVIAVGGALGHLAALDNFCWPDPIQSERTPDGQYKLAQLVRAARALSDTCIAYDLPLISGKDSMKNDYGSGAGKISIPPTLLVTAIGRMEDVERAVTMDAKRAGDLVYGVGVTRRELGGSEYYAARGEAGATVPVVRPAEARPLYEALAACAQRGLLASCHDCSDGGLGVALAESAFAGDLGMEVDLCAVPAEGAGRDDVLLFSESASRFVCTVAPERARDFEAALAGLPAARVGRVTAEPVLVVRGLAGEVVLKIPCEELRGAWRRPLAW